MLCLTESLHLDTPQGSDSLRSESPQLSDYHTEQSMCEVLLIRESSIRGFAFASRNPLSGECFCPRFPKKSHYLVMIIMLTTIVSIVLCGFRLSAHSQPYF